MKNLKDILTEGILDDIETSLANGDKYVDNLEFFKKITANRAAFYEFITDYLKTHYKKYRRAILRSRAGLKSYANTIVKLKEFDPNKKYFFICKTTLPGNKRHVASIFINDDDMLLPTCLTSFPAFTFGGEKKVDFFTYNDHWNYTVEEYVSNGSIDTIYEVPKELEWLYNCIKNGKL